MAKSTPKAEGRHFTPRKPLAKKDEAKLKAVSEAFADASAEALAWAERYGRKVLKHAAGLRATPAPIPPQLGAESAAKVREILGIVVEAPAADGKPAEEKAAK